MEPAAVVSVETSPVRSFCLSISIVTGQVAFLFNVAMVSRCTNVNSAMKRNVQSVPKPCYL